MKRGRPKQMVTLTVDIRQQLESISKSRSMPSGLVKRAEIILLCADGLTDLEVASKAGFTRETVGKWRRRFLELGLPGLHDEIGRGRPRTYKEEQVAMLINKTLQTKPEGETHWSCRSMANEVGFSASTVHRYWSLFNVQPHRQEHFKLSTDPFFVDKVIDIVGRYLNPPEN